jgi:uncharacterized protein DUF4291
MDGLADRSSASRGSKPGQEVTLGLRMRRSFFDSVLREAVASTFSQATQASEVEWRKALESSDVRLQWDPDHDPFGSRSGVARCNSV